MVDEVLYEVADRVAVITINRPDKRNALNAAVRQGLWDAWRRFEADADARVAILTGAGEKAFCAGMDLAEMSEAKRGVPPPDLMPDLGRNIRSTSRPSPRSAAIAYAGGWRLAQMCDLCVARQSARFAITEALVGRGAAWAAPLVHMIPQRIILELMLTGKADHRAARLRDRVRQPRRRGRGGDGESAGIGAGDDRRRAALRIGR